MGDASVSCIHCGAELLPETKDNPTFTTPDDWELVRVKVVEGLNKDAADDLTDFIDSAFVDFINTNNGAPQFSDAFHWWITRTPKEQCQIAADFIKSSHDLFPWVEEMKEGKG
jgi:hypothetical protein